MQWSPHQARYTLLLFLLLIAAGQVKACLIQPVYPDLRQHQKIWPRDGHLIDITALESGTLKAFSPGTTVAVAIAQVGLRTDRIGSGFCLPRAGVLYRGQFGWRIRSMTQRERWVWRIPMSIYGCEPQDLQRIRGVGPSLAGRIYRFVQGRGALSSLSDLEEVSGVGPGKLKLLMKELEIP